MLWNAVITADIVNSTRLPSATFKKLTSRIEAILKPHPVEFYRGDSFQVYVKNAPEALALLLQVRLLARQFSTTLPSLECDVRSAIGIGLVKGPVRDMNKATDDIFILSGRALDALDKEEDRLILVSRNEKANIAFRLLSQYLDHLIGHMTGKQALVIAELMKGLTQTEAAKKLKKTQVTIHRQAHAAGWKAITRLLKEYEIALNQFDLA